MRRPCSNTSPILARVYGTTPWLELLPAVMDSIIIIGKDKRLVGEAFREMVRGYCYYTEGSESEIIALLTLIAIREEKATAFLGYDKMEGGKGNRHYLLKIGEAESPLLNWKLECEGIIIWEEMIHLTQKDMAEKVEQP